MRFLVQMAIVAAVAYGQPALADAVVPASPDRALPPGDARALGLPTADDARFRRRFLEWSADAPLTDRFSETSITRALTWGRVSSGFGRRINPVTGLSAMHTGVDLPEPAGTPVRSMAAGVVVRAGYAGGYGNMVEVDHGGGVRTRYGHLSEIDVSAGANVASGSVIGAVGSTGRSTGPHLHFEVRINGVPIDPTGYGTTDYAEVRTFVAPDEAPLIARFGRTRVAPILALTPAKE